MHDFSHRLVSPEVPFGVRLNPREGLSTRKKSRAPQRKIFDHHSDLWLRGQKRRDHGQDSTNRGNPGPVPRKAAGHPKKKRNYTIISRLKTSTLGSPWSGDSSQMPVKVLWGGTIANLIAPGPRLPGPPNSVLLVGQGVKGTVINRSKSKSPKRIKGWGQEQDVVGGGDRRKKPNSQVVWVGSQVKTLGDLADPRRRGTASGCNNPEKQMGENLS